MLISIRTIPDDMADGQAAVVDLTLQHSRFAGDAGRNTPRLTPTRGQGHLASVAVGTTLHGWAFDDRRPRRAGR